jgi:KDO2-lipid IV(A) lauroyltransferase
MSQADESPLLIGPRYWPTWLAIGALRLCALLPYRTMMALGRGAGRLAMRFAGKRRAVAETNLRLCFPELDDTQRSALVARHFAALGMAAMDFAIAWWWRDAALYRWVEIEGREHIEQAMARGKGVIFLTAHFTSIEISGRLLANICPALPMYRPNANPLLERIMVRNRERHVERTIPRSDTRLMIRTLRDGKGVWFAPDQNFGAKGAVFAPFFGIAASSNPSLSRFTKMTGAAVVPFVVFRRPGGGYRLVAEPALDGFPSDDAVADTTRYNAITEAWIREAPEQYNWIHRRFKKRPPGEAPVY